MEDFPAHPDLEAQKNNFRMLFLNAYWSSEALNGVVDQPSHDMLTTDDRAGLAQIAATNFYEYAKSFDREYLIKLLQGCGPTYIHNVCLMLHEDPVEIICAVHDIPYPIQE